MNLIVSETHNGFDIFWHEVTFIIISMLIVLCRRILTKPILFDQWPALNVIADCPNGHVVEFTRCQTGERHLGVGVIDQTFFRRVALVANPETVQIELGRLDRCRCIPQCQRVRLISIDHHDDFRLDQWH